MKSRFTLLGIIATLIIGVAAVFVSCQKELNDIVTYRGEVVHINTTNPFTNLTVKVTNGTDTHCQTLTDEAGLFTLKVRVNEIDGNYYLLAGDSTCVPKKVGLGGYGQAEVDLGVIEVEGPTLPIVETDSVIREKTAESAIIGGKVLTDGRLRVTARGICYGTETYPTIDGLHTTDGNGLGEFVSNLKNLQHNTIYYARAYATNALGTAYGKQIKFTTEEGVAVVSTIDVDRVEAHSARCKGRVESDGGYPVTQRGTCWSTYPDPTISDDHTEDGSGLGDFASNLNNLERDTKYYVRTYAINQTATVYGEQMTFTTPDGLATVKITGSTSMATSMTIKCEVTNDGGFSVTERGICYSKINSEPSVEDSKIANGRGKGSYSVSVTDLNVATTYYVRAYADNENGVSYGAVKEVVTMDGVPSVTIGSVSNITALTAQSKVTIKGTGGAELQTCGICWSSTPNPTIDNNKKEADGTAINTAYTCNMSNLNPATTYYVRGYATTDIATAYSEEVTFQTKTGLASVSTTFIGENVTETTAISGGEIPDDGGFPVTARGVCWSMMTNPTINDNMTTDGSGTGKFSSMITGIDLTNSNTYYVRAYATNQNGTAYGNELVINKQNLVYKSLPRIAVDGYIYVLYNDMGDMFYDDAVNACQTLTYAGYDDWMLVPSDDQMRYIMENCLDGWKDLWGYPITVYTRENPAPSENVGGSGYYWTSDQSCIDGYQSTVQITCVEQYDWDTQTSYFAHSAEPHCTQVSSSRDRVRPVRRYADDGQGGGDVPSVTYYIKHSWGSGLDEDWTWKKMNKEGDCYTYTGAWGGIGANINKSANDAGAQWFPVAEIEKGDYWSIGDMVTFVYNPTTRKLSTR